MLRALSMGRASDFLICFLAIPAILTPSIASAFFDQLQTIPAAPRENEASQFSFRAGFCHGLVGEVQQPLSIERAGNVVEVTVAVLEHSGSWCIFPNITHSFGLPALPPGEFRVDLYSRSANALDGPRRLRGQLAFNVVAGQPEPRGVPANGAWAMILLFVSVGLLAVRRLLR
jgi:hypothetical protein